MSLIFRTFFIVLVIAKLSEIAFATNCLPSASLSFYYWNSPNILSVELVDVSKVEKSLVLSRVRFKVISVLKGEIKPNEEVIIEQRFNFDCSEYDFQKGESYLLFLGNPQSKDNVILSPPQFFNAYAVARLQNEEVQSFLEILNNGKPDYQIEGLIWSDSELKLNRIKLTAKKDKKTYRTEFLNHIQYSDFSIKVDEPGIYEVSILMPSLDDKASAISRSIYAFESKIKQIKKYKKQRKIEVKFEVKVEADKFPFFDLRIQTGLII